MKTYFTLILIFITSSALFAHKVSIFAYAENGQAFTESYFNDGKRVADARINVFDEKGKKIAEGTTDANGLWNFRIPYCTSIKFVLVASAGHRGEYLLSRDEVCAALSGNAPENQEIIQPEVKMNSEDTGLTPEENPPMNLKPLMEKLIRIEEKLDKPDFRDILGGIGYIMGIFGLWAYMKSRREKKSD